MVRYPKKSKNIYLDFTVTLFIKKMRSGNYLKAKVFSRTRSRLDIISLFIHNLEITNPRKASLVYIMFEVVDTMIDTD